MRIEIDITKYRGINKSLLYLIASRYDIIFSICMCMCVLGFNPILENLNFKYVKHILKYLNSISNHVI